MLARLDPPESDAERHPGADALVDEIAALAQPDAVHWCDGSDGEHEAFCEELVEAGTFTRLDPVCARTASWPAPTRAMSHGSRTAPRGDHSRLACDPLQ